MLSFGWSEIALVVIVVVIVVGPKELPNLIKNLGNFSKSLKKASRQFKNSLNELSEEGDLKDIKKELSTIKETVIFTDKEISKINNKIKND